MSGGFVEVSLDLGQFGVEQFRNAANGAKNAARDAQSTLTAFENEVQKFQNFLNQDELFRV